MCACTLCASVCINKNWPLILVIPSYWNKCHGITWIFGQFRKGCVLAHFQSIGPGNMPLTALMCCLQAARVKRQLPQELWLCPVGEQDFRALLHAFA